MSISEYIVKRLNDKKTDYTRYGFSRVESNALKTFFDLAQEFEKLEDVYQVSVAIPKSFFDLDARLYVVDSLKGHLVLVATTEGTGGAMGMAPPVHVQASQEPYLVDHSMILTIRGNKQLVEQLPFKPKEDVIGILEVFPYDTLDGHQKLFFEKYANRIGFSLHMRFLLQKNIEHVRFIKNLVTDIEHNVIVPNMIYKLFLRRLGGKIFKNRDIEETLKDLTCNTETGSDTEVCSLLAELKEVNRGLEEEFRNIEKHYESSSLFLETLLRKSHFDEGRLTLHTKKCNIKKDVIAPQLERFAGGFTEKGIHIEDQFMDAPDEEVITVVDVGLMAQVYGNLFSNALKYTQEMTTQEGKTIKKMAFGREVLRDYFGAGKDGVKYNVFSTGPAISREDKKNIFKEGYRGSGSENRPGTGHGLAFVKNAVEIHGGKTGYEAVRQGNNFFFVLPVHTLDDQEDRSRT
jgi:signal transduction histidine kinase